MNVSDVTMIGGWINRGVQMLSRRISMQEVMKAGVYLLLLALVWNWNFCLSDVFLYIRHFLLFR